MPTKGTAQGIRPYDANRRYWEYDERGVLLIGGSDEDNLFNFDTLATGERLEDQLDRLAAAGGNYVRNTMSDRDAGNVYAFAKVGDCYDLTQWNDVYWQRLDRFLQLTHQRDIVVQIELWDMWDLEGDGWARHPFNPANNVNYSAGRTTLPESWTGTALEQAHPFYQTTPAENNDEIVLGFQRRFVQKVLEHTLRWDHVLYVIANESRLSEHWSDYWQSFARGQAAAGGRRICVADMLFLPRVDPVLERGFDFAELSQSASGHERDEATDGHRGQGHHDAIARELSRLDVRRAPANSVKQYGGQIDWTCGPEEGISRVWRSIFAGQAGVRFHRPPYGIGLSSRAVAHIRSIRAVTEAVDVFSALPHRHAARLLGDRADDEAYLLAEPGRAYAVYFPDGGEVTLDISDAEGPLALRWLDTESTKWSDPSPVAGPKLRLETPGKGHWVAVVNRDS